MSDLNSRHRNPSARPTPLSSSNSDGSSARGRSANAGSNAGSNASSSAISTANSGSSASTRAGSTRPGANQDAQSRASANRDLQENARLQQLRQSTKSSTVTWPSNQRARGTNLNAERANPSPNSLSRSAMTNRHGLANQASSFHSVASSRSEDSSRSDNRMSANDASDGRRQDPSERRQAQERDVRNSSRGMRANAMGTNAMGANASASSSPAKAMSQTAGATASPRASGASVSANDRSPAAARSNISARSQGAGRGNGINPRLANSRGQGLINSMSEGMTGGMSNGSSNGSGSGSSNSRAARASAQAMSNRAMSKQAALPQASGADQAAGRNQINAGSTDLRQQQGRQRTGATTPAWDNESDAALFDQEQDLRNALAQQGQHVAPAASHNAAQERWASSENRVSEVRARPLEEREAGAGAKLSVPIDPREEKTAQQAQDLWQNYAQSSSDEAEAAVGAPVGASGAAGAASAADFTAGAAGAAGFATSAAGDAAGTTASPKAALNPYSAYDAAAAIAGSTGIAPFASADDLPLRYGSNFTRSGATSRATSGAVSGDMESTDADASMAADASMGAAASTDATMSSRSGANGTMLSFPEPTQASAAVAGVVANAAAAMRRSRERYLAQSINLNDALTDNSNDQSAASYANAANASTAANTANADRDEEAIFASQVALDPSIDANSDEADPWLQDDWLQEQDADVSQEYAARKRRASLQPASTRGVHLAAPAVATHAAADNANAAADDAYAAAPLSEQESLLRARLGTRSGSINSADSAARASSFNAASADSEDSESYALQSSLQAAQPRLAAAQGATLAATSAAAGEDNDDLPLRAASISSERRDPFADDEHIATSEDGHFLSAQRRQSDQRHMARSGRDDELAYLRAAAEVPSDDDLFALRDEEAGLNSSATSYRDSGATSQRDTRATSQRDTSVHGHIRSSQEDLRARVAAATADSADGEHTDRARAEGENADGDSGVATAGTLTSRSRWQRYLAWVLLLILALTTEVVACNFNALFFAAQDYPFLSLNLPYQEKLGKKALILNPHNPSIQAQIPNLPVRTLYVRLSDKMPRQTWTMQLFLKDESSAFSLVPIASADIVGHEGANERYLKILSQGKANEFVLNFVKQASASPIEIEAIEFNKAPPFNISLVRIMIMWAFFCLLYALFTTALRQRLITIESRPYKIINRTILGITAAFSLFIFVTMSPWVATDTGYSFRSLGVLPYSTVDGSLTVALPQSKAEMERADVYTQQLAGWLQGQLSLPYEPDPRLAFLRNVYDPSERAAQNIPYLFDRAYFHAQYFSSYGLTPLLTIYLPIYILTGKAPSAALAIFIAALYALLALHFLLNRLTKLICTECNPLIFALAKVACLLSSQIFILQSSLLFYALPYLSAITFAALTLTLLLGLTALLPKPRPHGQLYLTESQEAEALETAKRHARNYRSKLIKQRQHSANTLSEEEEVRAALEASDEQGWGAEGLELSDRVGRTTRRPRAPLASTHSAARSGSHSSQPARGLKALFFWRKRTKESELDNAPIMDDESWRTELDTRTGELDIRTGELDTRTSELDPNADSAAIYQQEKAPWGNFPRCRALGQALKHLPKRLYAELGGAALCFTLLLLARPSAALYVLALGGALYVFMLRAHLLASTKVAFSLVLFVPTLLGLALVLGYNYLCFAELWEFGSSKVLGAADFNSHHNGTGWLSFLSSLSLDSFKVMLYHFWGTSVVTLADFPFVTLAPPSEFSYGHAVVSAGHVGLMSIPYLWFALTILLIAKQAWFRAHQHFGLIALWQGLRDQLSPYTRTPAPLLTKRELTMYSFAYGALLCFLLAPLVLYYQGNHEGLMQRVTSEVSMIMSLISFVALLSWSYCDPAASIASATTTAAASTATANAAASTAAAATALTRAAAPDPVASGLATPASVLPEPSTLAAGAAWLDDSSLRAWLYGVVVLLCVLSIGLMFFLTFSADNTYRLVNPELFIELKQIFDPLSFG